MGLVLLGPLLVSGLLMVVALLVIIIGLLIIVVGCLTLGRTKKHRLRHPLVECA